MQPVWEDRWETKQKHHKSTLDDKSELSRARNETIIKWTARPRRRSLPDYANRCRRVPFVWETWPRLFRSLLSCCTRWISLCRIWSEWVWKRRRRATRRDDRWPSFEASLDSPSIWTSATRNNSPDTRCLSFDIDRVRLDRRRLVGRGSTRI